MNFIDLQAALSELAAPCDSCPSASTCAAQLLACSSFHAFVSLRRWRTKPRTDATTERFALIFTTKDRPLVPRGKRNRKAPGGRGNREAVMVVTA